MFCKKCGNELTENVMYCPSCGEKTDNENSTALFNDEADAFGDTPTKKKEKNKKKKPKKKLKIILLLVAVFFVISILASMGDDTSNQQMQTDNSDGTIKTTENVQNNSDDNSENKEENNTQKNKDEKYSDSEIISFYKDCKGKVEVDSKKFCKEVSEDRFFSLWCSLVYEECVRNTAFDKTTRNIISNNCYSYRLIWKDTTKLTAFDAAIEKMDEYLKEKDIIVASLGYNPDTSVIYEDDFYIIKRLETRYDDNFLGDLQEILDNVTADNSSNWLAANVDYFYGQPMSGDEDFVIYSTTLNPFTKEGAYTIRYVDSGKTMELVNNSGFVSDVPVYRMIQSNGTYSEMDFNLLADSFESELNNIKNIAFSNWKAADGDMQELTLNNYTVSDLVNMTFNEIETFFGKKLSFVEGDGGCGIYTIENCPNTYFMFEINDWINMYTDPNKPVSYIYVDSDKNIDGKLFADMTSSEIQEATKDDSYFVESYNGFDELNERDYYSVKIERNNYTIRYDWYSDITGSVSADQVVLCGISTEL